MSLATIADQEVHVDDEGFMTEYDEWNEGLASNSPATSASTSASVTWRRSAS